MDRITDKRLAEIEKMRMRCVPMIKGTDVLPASSELTEELLQALKAERKAYRDICEEMDDAQAEHPVHLKKLITELEAKQAKCDEWAFEMCKKRTSLEAQIEAVKEMIVLYFEGCSADTFDDKIRKLREAIK